MSTLRTFICKRLTLLRWASWFAALNGILIAAFSLNFVRYMPEFVATLQSGYVGAALLGQFGLLSYLAFLLLLLPLTLLLPWHRLIKPLAVLLGTLGCAGILLDYLVYTQYRFHINGVLLNLVIEDAGQEIFVFSWWTWLLALLGLVAILGVQLMIGAGLTRWLKPGTSRRGGWLALGIVAALLGSHGVHVWADAHYDQRITSLTRHIPFYYPTTAKGFLQKRGWADLDKNREQAQALMKEQNHSQGLDYPKAPLSCEKDDPLNVLMIVVDTWRFDEMESRVTPYLDQLSREPETFRFDQHLSGGNSTKSGLFSLMYGLPSSYWDALASGLTGPVLIDEFQRRDYQFGIFSSADLTHPAFDRTVFAKIPDLRTHSTSTSPWRRDREINQEWLRFLKQRDQQRPFFGFLFYDASHGYDYPADAVKPYTPVWDRVDHLALDADFDPLPYFNRHRTSVRFVDDLIRDVVEDLKAKGLYDNTLILITSDHGEEFNDNGLNYWGHGSNYTRYQVQVPMLVRFPGRSGTVVGGRTSHMDVAPTLLREVLGCRNPSTDYSIGVSLFDEAPRRWLYSGSYYNYAILLDDSILVTYPTGNYEFMDPHNRPLPERNLDAKMSLDILKALSRFYR